jgi:hypothetical protein
MIYRRRLLKYLRRKREARTSGQFLKWSLRYHALSNRLYGPPDLWSVT